MRLNVIILSFESLDLFMAGDDVKEKKPDPTIYRARGGGCTWAGDAHVLLLNLVAMECPSSGLTLVDACACAAALAQEAARRLGVDPCDCLVVEDSTIGLAAARGAGMRCLVTFTHSTRGQEFAGAECVLESLEGVRLADLAAGRMAGRDDRVVAAATA